MLRFLAFALTVTTLACVTANDPHRASVQGHLQLVPHADLLVAKSGGNAYGDRRLRNAQLVDYSRPGFSVVYVDAVDAGDQSKADTKLADLNRGVRLSIDGGDTRTRFEPAQLAIRMGNHIRLKNRDREPHVVSCPEASLLQSLLPGQEVRIELPTSGEYRLYLADVPGTESIVFAAPGPYAVVSIGGRFRVSDLTPGARTLHAWHPRFPPASHDIELTAGDSLVVDFEIGVGQNQELRP